MIKQYLFGAVAGAMIGLTSCEAGDALERTPEASTDDTPTMIRTDAWTYIEVDSTKAMWGDFNQPEWLRYFGMTAGDINGDGYLDIVSGRTVYMSPGGDLTDTWEQVDLGRNVDANLIYRDADGRTSILAESLPDVVQFKVGEDGKISEGKTVATVPPTGHHNGQGYKVANLLSGTGSQQIIYASQGGLYVLNPATPEPWQVTLVGKDASDEGLGVADMDGDGDQDLISGYRVPGADAEVPTVVVWFENPGGLSEDWKRHHVGNTIFATDRVEAADLNGDSRPEVVVAEERYPGEEPDANLWVFTQVDTGFVREKVVTQYSMNNLALIDMDYDGDIDILTAEHKGPNLALQLWANDGKGKFTAQELDRGKESHLGTQPYDMDGDGDLDIISIGWDQHQFVHLWRNDAQ